MNKLVRGLLSGASLATLQLCAIGVARATTISTTRGAYTNPAGATTGSILVTNTGDITGDLTNEGTVGPDSYYGVQVDGTIGGSLINTKSGIISGTEVGILVGSTASIAGGIQNAGKILVTASEADGYVQDTGIYYNTHTGAAITNTGTIGVNVQVIGTDTEDATAIAHGVIETGNASFGASISHSFSNSGSITLTAGAAAASDSAYARADAVTAVKQGLYDAATLDATITNSGSISFSAIAKAAASNSSATALAGASRVFYQSAANSAHHAGDSIDLTVTNSGSLAMAATATANGETKARADAFAGEVFTQRAENAGDIAEKISNSGSLTLAAAAHATAQSTFAKVKAHAHVSRLFYQSAGNQSGSGFSAGETIAQTITNSGDVTISAIASAKRPSQFTTAGHCCDDKVNAQASANDLFYQRAFNAAKITQSITNSGALTIGALATATGVYRETEAEAGVHRLFTQDASDANSATLSIVNSAPIKIHVTAVSTGNKADAFAEGSQLFFQVVGDGGAASQSITNSGDLSFFATASAKAKGTSGARNASAEAFLRTALKQEANSDDSIIQSLTNSATLNFNLAAKASGLSEVSATARAQGIKQTAAHVPLVHQTVSNTGTIAFVLNANAVSPKTNDEVEATAQLEFGAKQFARSSGTAASAASASIAITNSGTISLTATAVARGGTEARAEATVDNLIKQEGEGMGSLTALVSNTGTISAQNLAQAFGNSEAIAEASVDGIVQVADRVADASLSVVNRGTVNLQATATAVATSFGHATAGVFGIQQSAKMFLTTPATSQNLSVNNTGSIKLAANATGTFGFMGHVTATAIGVEQKLGGVAGTATVRNTGTINVVAVAAGLPGTLGAGVTATTAKLPSVHAVAAGLSVRAFGDQSTFHRHSHNFVSTRVSDFPASAALAVNNSGTVSVVATANGLSLGAANITAVANGIAVLASSQLGRTSSRQTLTGLRTSFHHQESGAGTASGTISNSGMLSATASAPGGVATADGILITADQDDVAVTNAKGGVISAEATGSVATAAGVLINGSHQMNNSVRTSHDGSFLKQHTESSLAVPAGKFSGSITNSGSIEVSAVAAGDYIGNGLGHDEFVRFLGSQLPASVAGVRADGIAVNAVDMSANILNAGTIDVSAQGPAALANGIRIFASQSGAQSVVHASRFFSTTGFKTAKQSALNHLQTGLANNTVSGQITNTGTLNVSASGAGAAANGIDIEADTLDGAVVNSGVINVSANGTGAVAEGIVIDANTLGSGASFQNNGGTIIATENGKRGTAIDVSAAPATLVLGLNGGSIYGNVVENEAGNAVSVGSGDLVLNGIINPSKAKVGSLTVGANGTLTLANNAVEGNAMAYVNSFVQNGTLAIIGGADGSSGSINAAKATLSGGALVDLNFSGGAYGTSTTYKVVFSDAALSGTWSSVRADQATTFFSASGVYSTNEADITLTRATFDSIAGLTSNEAAVGAAIETIYDTSGLTGPLGKLFGALFNLTPQQYADALESLSGIPAGELSAVDQSAAQSFLDAISSHLGNTSGDTGGVASLMSPSPVLASNMAPSNVAPAQVSSLSGTHVWGGGFQSGNSVDRTASGPAYTSHQSGLLAGIDVPVSPNALIGVAASWSTGDINTEKALGFGTFSAGQFAGYGRFTTDNGIYGLGSVSYGDFTNKLNRFISIPGFGSGHVNGKFDSTVWGLYGEAGWHLDPSDAGFGVTPYAAISYLDAKSDGFTETGFGAPLVIGGSSSKATSSYLGVKLENTWQMGGGTITPRLTAAWQHDFTKNAWEMSAAFAAVPTVGFGLDGSALSRDGAYVDGGITLGIADSVDVLLDYQGRFTSDRTDNAFMARANFKFW